MIVPDFKVNGLWVKSTTIGGKSVRTISGTTYNNLSQRSNPNGYTQRTQPTYKGCTNAFKDFESFTDWHTKQIGYGLGYHLDSDILRKGPKVYSEDTCVLLPQYVNAFFQSSKGQRGKFPAGLSWYAQEQCIQVHIKSAYYGGKSTCLGKFQLEDIDLARELYRIEKNRACKYLKEKLIEDSTLIDSRVLSIMDTWEHICDWKGFD